jgi:hypothetical protein
MVLTNEIASHGMSCRPKSNPKLWNPMHFETERGPKNGLHDALCISQQPERTKLRSEGIVEFDFRAALHYL